MWDIKIYDLCTPESEQELIQNVLMVAVMRIIQVVTKIATVVSLPIDLPSV